MQVYYHGTTEWHRKTPLRTGLADRHNDVNITVCCKVKFHPVKVKLALTTSCICIMARIVHEITNLYLRNQVHHIVAIIAENTLKLTYAYLYFKKFYMDRTTYCYTASSSLPSPGDQKILYGQKTRFNKVLGLTPKIHQNSPVSIYNGKHFPGNKRPDPLFKGEGREGSEGKGRKGGKGKREEERRGKGRGEEGRGGEHSK
jgi:hypothetical protein